MRSSLLFALGALAVIALSSANPLPVDQLPTEDSWQHSTATATTAASDQSTATATTASDNVVSYTYDFTNNAPDAKGEGTLQNFFFESDLSGNQPAKRVIFQGNPGKSWGFTLACQPVRTGEAVRRGTYRDTGFYTGDWVPLKALRAVYTDKAGENYYGPITEGSGCSTVEFGSRYTLTCCIPPISTPAKQKMALATLSAPSAAPAMGCPMCKMGVNQVLSKLSADKLSPHLDQICDGLPNASAQAMCKAGVATGLPVVDSYLQNLDAEQVCTMAQMCRANEFMPKLPTAKIPCPVCKLTVKNALKNLTAEKIAEKLAANCAKLDEKAQAGCMLAAKMGQPLFEKMLPELDASTICAGIGSCAAPVQGMVPLDSQAPSQRASPEDPYPRCSIGGSTGQGDDDCQPGAVLPIPPLWRPSCLRCIWLNEEQCRADPKHCSWESLPGQPSWA